MSNNEIWKDIKGYEGLYQISNKCRVKSLYNYKRNGTNILKPKIKHQYYQIGLRKDGVRKWYQLHRLLAEAFMPEKSKFKSMPYEDRTKIILNKLVINHKDENRLNNNLENLEWCTISYNNCYGTRIQKVKSKTSKKILKYDMNMNFIKEYCSIAEASRQENIDSSAIVKVCKGKYKQLKGFVYVYK